MPPGIGYTLSKLHGLATAEQNALSTDSSKRLGTCMVKSTGQYAVNLAEIRTIMQRRTGCVGTEWTLGWKQCVDT